MKIIFLNSYSPRTGHNFAAQVLKIVSAAEIIPHDEAETRLSLFLESYYRLKEEHFIKGRVQEFLDSVFLKNARERILKNYTGSYLLIKDTNHQGVAFQKMEFPDDIHFLLYRDPRDTLISIFKGMRFYNQKGFKAGLKKIGYWSGLYSFYYSWKYSNRFIRTIPSDPRGFFIIKYEDLVQRDEKTLKRIIQIFNSNLTVKDLIAKINEISVINTSFHKEETGGKHIWDRKEATSRFKPVNRKNIPFLHRKGIELGSKKFRKKLGYI